MQTNSSTLGAPRCPPRFAPRDHDLLESDGTLDDEILDNLWKSFNEGLDDQVDRQVLFVRMINSIRRPYKQKLNRVANHEMHAVQARPAPEWLQIDTPSVSEYSASEYAATIPCNSLDRSTEVPKAIDVTPQVVIMPLNLLNFAFRRFIQVNPTVHVNLTLQANHTLSPDIRTPNANQQMEMDAWVGTSDTISPEAIFNLHRFEDGTVAFKSSKYENLYLRAFDDADSPAPASTIPMWTSETGIVDAKCAPCGDQQRFRIHRLSPQSAAIGLESVYSPGNFIKLAHGRDRMGSLGLQKGHGMASGFLIVVCPPEGIMTGDC